jgi:hypothetical protein
MRAPQFADYEPATVRTHVNLVAPDAKQKIENFCRREQEAMLLWLNEGTPNDRERLKPKFNGTFGSLCDLYESDEEKWSGFSG